MWPELETFLTEYRKFLAKTTEGMVDIMRDEMTGIYQAVADDPHSVEAWDKFREMIRSPIPFEAKYARSRELISEACGKPAGATH